MGERGLLTSFLVGEIALAITALALLGAILSMETCIRRSSGRERLDQVAGIIADALETVDSLPGEVEILRHLPGVAEQLKVSLRGELRDQVQVVRIRVVGEGQLERTVVITRPVNGGDFTLEAVNPNAVHASKSTTIQLELV